MTTPPTPRYSRLPFPPYRYVPGRSPHPTRDPKGHSHGRPDPTLDSFEPEHWQRCEVYLYGIDLFNHGYWWEAHEALELVWKTQGRQTPSGLYLQGLIQLGVALLKKHQGFDDAARKLWLSGSEKMAALPAIHLGIDGPALCRAVGRYLEGRDPEPPRIRLARLDAPPHGPSG